MTESALLPIDEGHVRQQQQEAQKVQKA